MLILRRCLSSAVPSTSAKLPTAARIEKVNTNGKKISSTPTRSTLVENTRKNHGKKMQTMNENIEMMNAERENLKDELEVRSRFVSFIERAVLNETQCRFLPVGSTITGLTTSGSDFDYVLFVRDKARRENFHQLLSNIDNRKVFLKKLRLIIARHAEEAENPVIDTFVLASHRVPLLYMKFQDGTSIDVTLPDPAYQSVRNSQLMRCYSQADSRLPRLFLWLKAMFTALGIKDSKAGLLSSYHLLCLLVHFLQCEQALHSQTVLPVLSKTHPQLVGRELPIDEVANSLLNPIAPLINGWSSSNKMDCAELWLRFVEYYEKLDVNKNAIYIARGTVNKASQLRVGPRLQIIDPYSDYTICRSAPAMKAFIFGINFLKKELENGNFIDRFPTAEETKELHNQLAIGYATNYEDRDRFLDEE